MPNHMPPSAIDDIHCSLKTGGYFVTAMRSYLFVDEEKHGYKDKINELIRDGKFRLHSQGDFTRGYKGGIDLFKEEASVYVVLQRVD
jgi:hypothetical protein